MISVWYKNTVKALIYSYQIVSFNKFFVDWKRYPAFEQLAQGVVAREIVEKL